MKAKKTIVFSIILVCVAAVSGYHAYTSQNNNIVLTELVSANIEALADGGEGGPTPCGGPKTSVTGTCKAQNQVNCKDDRGCQ